MPTVRLLSVDAHELTGAAAQIARESPDVVCVHGAPRLLRWRSRCAALARVAGLVVVSGGRTGAGNLLLSSLGVDVVGTRDVRFPGSSIARPAGATLALLRRDESAFVVAAANVHGALARQSGELQAEITAVIGLGEPSGALDAPSVISLVGAVAEPAPELTTGRVALPGGWYVDERMTVENSAELAADSPRRCVRLTLSQPAARSGDA